MPKKNRTKQENHVGKPSETLANPFAALSSLRDALPPGEAHVEDLEESLPTQSSRPRPRPRVILRRQRKGHGGKTVTRVEGLTQPTPQFAADLKRELGVGARWDEDALIVQGDQVERLTQLLEARGYRITVGS